MDIVNHLFAALGRILLSISSALVLEELMLGGLARLLLSKPFDARGKTRRRVGKTRDPAVPGSTEKTFSGR